MPEGDTIHAHAHRLGEVFTGQRLREARVDGQPIESFRGASVDRIFAIGKHLFVACGQDAIRVHLGMHGRWRRASPGRPANVMASAFLATDRAAYQCLYAKEAEFIDLEGDRFRRFKRTLGVDLTEAGADLDAALERTMRGDPSRPICDVLLDQRVTSGIGNVYKCEVLFLTGVRPARLTGSIEPEIVRRMYELAHQMLRRNLVPGMRRTRAAHPREVLAASSSDEDDRRYWVYSRAREPCDACGDEIRYTRMGRHNRATYWCDGCQS